MDRFYIYLAGAMEGLSADEMSGWRYDVERGIKKHDWYENYVFKPVFFNPVVSYTPFDNLEKSDREPFEYDLSKLRKSDLVVVNFNKPESIGTAMELAVARERRIPIIGLNENGVTFHSWLKECCTRICDTMEELINHVALYYLDW